MGGVFARALLRAGFPLYPVTRQQNLAAVIEANHEPECVLLTVGENDLQAVLQQLPQAWHDCLLLLQNELLPRDWLQHGIKKPTVISVWFEKKKGQDFRIIIPSPIYGPYAKLFAAALSLLDIPTRVLNNEAELLFELVRKNVYILTTNIAGLVTGGNVGALWADHQELAREVAHEVITIQEWLTGDSFDEARLIAGMVEAIDADPDHGCTGPCTGRSAPARLQRALGFAGEAGIAVSRLQAIRNGLDK